MAASHHSAEGEPSTRSFHPVVATRKPRGRGKLGLRDAVAMAVGGMVGGGIFSVLGATVALAGHLAAGAFIIGGAIALMTAHSFAVLSARTGRSGGLFVYLREAGFPRVAGFVSWVLIFGYVIALAVYGFTFGHYAANVFGLPTIVADAFAAAILALFLLINLRGVSASALSEDVVVLVKIVILAVIAGIGIAQFTPERFSPLANDGVVGVFIAATAIFVAYEGFELLSYDYDDIDDPQRVLPRALYLSVAIVIAIYVLVTIGSQMLVSDAVIVAQKEVAFATAGQAALGPVGYWLATVGALLATGSAINATLFSTARQIHEIARERELPAVLGKSTNALPVPALVALSVFGAAFAMLPSITSLLIFGSAIFLAVFGATNLLAMRIATTARARIIGAVGFLACSAAVIVLIVQLVMTDAGTLLLMGACLTSITIARLVFVWWRGRRDASSLARLGL